MPHTTGTSSAIRARRGLVAGGALVAGGIAVAVALAARARAHDPQPAIASAPPPAAAAALEPGAATPAPEPAAARAPAAPAAPAAATAASPWAGRLEQLDAMTYAVDRALIRELVANPTGDRTRIVPVVASGAVRGVRLTRAEPGGVAAAVGLRRGDLLATVDGAPLTHSRSIQELLARLDAPPAIEVGIERDGQPLQLVLKLR